MDTMVGIRHLRIVNMCARGGRAWFEKYNLSWNTFITDGYPASVLAATGDVLALKVVAAAEREKTDGQ